MTDIGIICIQRASLKLRFRIQILLMSFNLFLHPKDSGSGYILGIKPLKAGDQFTCNFYKICESKQLEHYASFAPIISDKPNFHLPQFFEAAIIVEV